jgi:CheY-like chemotaxis protein
VGKLSAKQPPILVIDDDPDVRRVFRRMLGPETNIVEASSGAEGLEHYASPDTMPLAPGLVILDLAMPGMTGAECFTRLRALDPEVPIAIVSGFPKDQHIAPLLASGNVEFLAKPFQREELLAMVDRLRRE